MKLTALKTFRHGSTVYRRNEPVVMSETQSKLLLKKKLVAVDADEKATKRKSSKPTE